MKTNTKNAPKTYTIQDLVDIDIDSWVEGIAAMSDIKYVKDEIYECVKDNYDSYEEYEDECPAEFENQYDYIADRDEFRFSKSGKIVSYTRKTK